MATFEDFLNERNITLKRRYTENHPAQTVGNSAKVRNAIIEALKDGKLTVDEFNEIVGQHSSAPSKWTRGNKRFFKIEEDGVSLSKYGTKILNSLVTESTINEKMSNAELKKISKTKEYVEISQAIRAGQSDYEDMYDMIDPKMFKGLDLKKFEEILDDWFNDEGMAYDSYADFARNAYSYHVAEITKLLMPFNESVDEGLNKSDVAYQLAIDYTGNSKPKITKLNKKRIQIKYGYKISPEKVIDSIKKVHPEVELKHVEWSDKMTGGGFHIFDILESAITEGTYDSKDHIGSTSDGQGSNAEIYKKGRGYYVVVSGEHDYDFEAKNDKELINKLEEYEFDSSDILESAVTEARVSAKKLLKSVVNGETNSVEGIKLSKGMAQAFSDWLDQSSYGRKFSELPFEKLLSAAFNWGIERYAKDSKLKNELKELKTKVKAMKESKLYKDFNQFVSESLNEAKPKINVGRYQREGKLGYNDQFHGRHSLSFTLGIDLGLDPKNEFSGGDWPGFDREDLYINGGKKEGTVLVDALSGEYTYDDLKSALAKFLGIKESVDGFEQDGEDYLESFKLDESFTSKLTGIARRSKDVKDFVKMVFKHEKFKAFDTPKTQPDSYKNFLNFIKGHYEMVQQYESNKIEENMVYTSFQEFVNESLELNEALKSSKLRGLLTMKRGTKQILKAIYGFSKIALDKITDDQIIDIDPKAGKKAEGLVVYYTTQEKDNPYADTSKSNYNATGKIPANTILAMGMGKDVMYIKRDYIKRKMTMSLTTDPRKSSHDIGINKEYRGWDASGIYNVKRVIDVADAAFVINTNALPNAKGKIEDRIKAKEGAVSFKSDKEFKDANMARYKEILQKRASELPIDKLVEKAIDDASGVIKDGLKNQEKNKYGELIAGVGKNGKAYKLNDVSNFITKLISNYERWSGYMATIEQAEAKYGKDSKEYKWEANYAEKESSEYAKAIKDSLSKLKNRNLGW